MNKIANMDLYSLYLFTTANPKHTLLYLDVILRRTIT